MNIIDNREISVAQAKEIMRGHVVEYRGIICIVADSNFSGWDCCSPEIHIPANKRIMVGLEGGRLYVIDGNEEVNILSANLLIEGNL